MCELHFKESAARRGLLSFLPEQLDGFPTYSIFSPIAGFEVGLEFFLEGFAAAMDEGFGGGEGAAKDSGDVFVAQIVLAAEEHGATLVFGKFVQDFLDLFNKFAVQQVFRGGDL